MFDSTRGCSVDAEAPDFDRDDTAADTRVVVNVSMLNTFNFPVTYSERRRLSDMLFGNTFLRFVGFGSLGAMADWPNSVPLGLRVDASCCGVKQVVVKR